MEITKEKDRFVLELAQDNKEKDVVFDKVIEEGEWPMNGSFIPVSLIPKPDGGDRPIGVTPLMVALFLKSLTGFVLTWDEAAMDFWEDAVKGSSALRAGLYRRLKDECACALGAETASIFWDVETFYDSIAWAKLLEWALARTFPTTPRHPRRISTQERFKQKKFIPKKMIQAKRVPTDDVCCPNFQ